MSTFHHDEARMFAAALAFTQDQTGFAVRLIEKDYFCTLLLEYLAVNEELVFKGGTCLSKIHASFYRLSEDLDFVLPMPTTARRFERSKKAVDLKQAVATLPKKLPCFQVLSPLEGANKSTQYNAVVGYESLTSGREETIKIEVSLREPLLLAADTGQARTLMLDPVRRGRVDLVAPLGVKCISMTEAYAEKFRAALSRPEVAVRDFFDLDYAVRKLGLRTDAALIKLVRRKLTVMGNPAVDVSEARLAELQLQLMPQLQPVLRPQDFAEFDLERAFHLVKTTATKIVA